MCFARAGTYGVTLLRRAPGDAAGARVASGMDELASLVARELAE